MAKDKDGLEKNLDKIKNRIRETRPAMGIHWIRHEEASWLGGTPFSKKESKFHTGMNIVTEFCRMAPYAGAHILVWIIALLMFLLCVAVGITGWALITLLR